MEVEKCKKCGKEITTKVSISNGKPSDLCAKCFGEGFVKAIENARERINKHNEFKE